ncbi:YdcF family protein [Neisseriaceae bacterium PsAf]|nr:YdcF family protein [Neisseriaceae bacterium PsAf]MCV2503209.1 YdcF family protein [Neisseriaceae bacterium]
MKKILTIIKFLVVLFLISYVLIFARVASAKHKPNLNPADAIIVLGAAAWGERPSPVFRNRIDYAIELYQNGLADNIIFTGGTPDKNYTSEGEVAAKWAIDKEIPAAHIFADTTSRNTYENLLHAKKIAQQNNFNTFIIVSDAYHLTRAKIISLLLGMDVQTAATPYSNFNSSDWKTKLKTYFKETNSVYGSIIYHYIHPYISRNQLKKWF